MQPKVNPIKLMPPLGIVYATWTGNRVGLFYSSQGPHRVFIYTCSSYNPALKFNDDIVTTAFHHKYSWLHQNCDQYTQQHAFKKWL